MCPIFQVSNVSGENLDLLKMFLNLLSTRLCYKKDEPAEFQIDDTFSVPVSKNDAVEVLTSYKPVAGEWTMLLLLGLPYNLVTLI